LFSEIGIPYDMDDKYAYKTGDFSSQTRASDANHFALEGSQVSYTWWTYCATNNHEWGDNWNGEDLSIFSVDDTAPERGDETSGLEPYVDSPKGSLTTVDSSSLRQALATPQMSANRVSISSGASTGTRAAEAFIRPAPVRISGTLISYRFNLASATFVLEVNGNEPAEATPTEIFLPLYHFPKDSFDISVSDGRWNYENATQTLRWWHKEGSQKISVVGEKRFSQTYEDDTYLDMFKNAGCTVM